LSVATISSTFGPGLSGATALSGTPVPVTPTSRRGVASTPLTSTWMRTTSTLSVTRPVMSTCDSVVRASGSGELIVIFGA